MTTRYRKHMGELAGGYRTQRANLTLCRLGVLASLKRRRFLWR